MSEQEQSVRLFIKSHDAFFKAVGSIIEVAREFIRCGLSEEALQNLDLDTLELSSTSFISDQLRESLSDLVYVCQSKTGFPTRICLLFEHKSSRPGRSLILQLLRYEVEILEEDMRQGRDDFSLSIPIVFYHGKEPWKKQTLMDAFGPIPDFYRQFVPDFQFFAINLQAMSDSEIRAMDDAYIVRNLFLVMKHAWEDEFYLQNLPKLILFRNEGLRPEALEMLLQLIIQYVYHVSSLNMQTIMGATNVLPQQQQEKVRDFWKDLEAYFEEVGMARGMEKGMAQGLEKGMAQGMAQGMEKSIAILECLHNFPNASDLEIAEKLSVSAEDVQKIRNAVSKP